jgi:hypothetical protein
MNSKLKIDLLEVLTKHNVIPETYLRNEKIMCRYIELRENGVKGKDAREQVASEFFTSIKTVERALYAKEKC